MVLDCPACIPVLDISGGGKNKLPCPFGRGFGVLPCQRGLHVYLTQTLFEITAVGSAYFLQVTFQRFDYRFRQYRHAILIALAAAHAKLVHVKVNVLHLKSQAFDQTKSRSVQQVTRNPVFPIQLRKYLPNFLGRKHHRQTLQFPRPLHGVQLRRLQRQNLSIEEQQRVEGLGLSRSRDLAVYRQVAQKHLNFNLAELARMAPFMESNKTPILVIVGFLRSVTVVLETNSLSDDLQQHRLF